MTQSLSKDATMKEVHDKTLKLGTLHLLPFVSILNEMREREKNTHRTNHAGVSVVLQ